MTGISRERGGRLGGDPRIEPDAMAVPLAGFRPGSAGDEGPPATANRLPRSDSATRWRNSRLARQPRGDCPAHPPAAVVKAILATPDRRSRPRRHHQHAGFRTRWRTADQARLPRRRAASLRSPPGFAVPAFPDALADRHRSARPLLLDDLLGDFPFTGDAERAHGSPPLWVSCGR